MSYVLKDGSQVEDPRLDRLIEFDEKSRNFPLMAVIPDEQKEPRSYTWRIEADYLIDQGMEGACVGFMITNELMARPAEVKFSALEDANEFARVQVYHPAQLIDPWAGGAYPGASPFYEGTSVLAGLKIGQNLGYYEEYRWTFSLKELVIGVGRYGPACLGLWWFDTNYTPNRQGFIGPWGNKVGGHAILARAVKIEWVEGRTWETHGWDAVDMYRSYFTLRNTWGRWGIADGGDVYVTLHDMGLWIADQGEAAFMMHRTVNP